MSVSNPPSGANPREGMMATVRNRRAMITGVQPYDADEAGRFHIVDVEYTDGPGVETDTLLWEVEINPQVQEPSALPQVYDTPPMDVREFDAMVRASRWSALTPSLPFSGLDQDRPPLAAPLYGAVYPEAYQLVPVLKALEMPRVALMLADAVGLGKTIQAGMVLRELMLRRRIRRVLILCPAALRTQWREEMSDKFALPFEIVDRPQTLNLQREIGVDANPWRTHERIIASYHYLKQPDVLEQFRTTAEPGEDGCLRWDLLIVDEAHNLAPASFGSDSDLSRTLQAIAPWFEHRVFLTATPHNGHTRSFSGLLETLDPVRFTRKSEFTEEDRQRVGETVVRRLKSEINDCYTSTGQAPRFSERIVDPISIPHFGAQERELMLALHDFRRVLRKVTKGASPQERTAANFATEVLQKRLLSGPWAFGQSWLTLVEGLQDPVESVTAATVARAMDVSADDTDNDAEKESRQRHADKVVGAWLRQWKQDVQDEIDEVTRRVRAIGVTRVIPGLEPAEHDADVMTRAQKVETDARLRAIEQFLDTKLRAGDGWRDDERLVIFTEYLASQEYIYARLRTRYGAGDWLLSFYGGMNDAERDLVKRAFNDPRGPARILVATDAAGEGLNLQRAARYLIHWDIPWNPARMEQRNGRLDRHGQERDVYIYHFDSPDDASMKFLGKVLRKRSQTREDRVVTDEIFAEAILAHFAMEELSSPDDASSSDQWLENVVEHARAVNSDVAGDLPSGVALPGADDLSNLEKLKSEIDLSPGSLRETLETTLAINAGRPRLAGDGLGRDRFVPPIPPAWSDIIDQTLREENQRRSMYALVFNPEQYVQTRNGRPVYLPEPDSKLLHLGDAIYHRVMSTFARYRFDSSTSSATRWTVRQGRIPDGLDAILLLTVEELAVNELRESCHHWVKTIAYPVRHGRLLDPLPHVPAVELGSSPVAGDHEIARRIWDDVEVDLKTCIKHLQAGLTSALSVRLAESGKAVREFETRRFEKRRRELERAMGDNQISKLEREANRERERARQMALFADMDHEMQKRLSDLEAELVLRSSHYDQVLERLAAESERTLKQVLPKRYKLRGEARVYPVAVEIRLNGGER